MWKKQTNMKLTNCFYMWKYCIIFWRSLWQIYYKRHGLNNRNLCSHCSTGRRPMISFTEMEVLVRLLPSAGCTGEPICFFQLLLTPRLPWLYEHQTDVCLPGHIAFSSLITLWLSLFLRGIMNAHDFIESSPSNSG